MAQHSKGSVVTDASTDFIETAVSVLRLSVDRFDASDNLKVDLTEILLLLARYTHKLGREDAALRIKTKLAQLIESVLAKPNVVILDDNDGTRNNLLEWIVDWPAVSNRVCCLPERTLPPLTIAGRRRIQCRCDEQQVTEGPRVRVLKGGCCHNRRPSPSVCGGRV